MLPSLVNFNALLIRFKMIWCRRIESPNNMSGIRASYSFISSRFFSLILVSNKCSMVVIETAILKGVCINTIFPASTFARSRMSLIRKIKVSPLVLMADIYSSCFDERSVLNNTFVKPIIAFIGVRISWLMLDKNCCFDFIAFSAASIALCALFLSSLAISFPRSANTAMPSIFFLVFTCSVISMSVLMAPEIFPSLLYIGLGYGIIYFLVPSGRSRTSSGVEIPPPFNAIAIGHSSRGTAIPLVSKILNEPHHFSFPVTGSLPHNLTAAVLYNNIWPSLSHEYTATGELSRNWRYCAWLSCKSFSVIFLSVISSIARRINCSEVFSLMICRAFSSRLRSSCFDNLSMIS